MKKIGFIDYYLDEWHANNLPAWIAESAYKGRVEIGWAWAEKDREGGLTSREWCRQHGVSLAETVEEVVEKSDYLVVLSPDNPEHHEELADAALRSGKPTYIDKTFAPDLETARRIFAWAETHGTPLFSSSALRFADELGEVRSQVKPDEIAFVSTGGSGSYAVYAVHQLEMIVSLMGIGARRIVQVGNESAPAIAIDFGEGRRAGMQMMAKMPFRVSVQTKDGRGLHVPSLRAAFFHRLVDSMMGFFESGEAPVPKEQTLEIMALIEAGREALRKPDEWVEL